MTFIQVLPIRKMWNRESALTQRSVQRKHEAKIWTHQFVFIIHILITNNDKLLSLHWWIKAVNMLILLFQDRKQHCFIVFEMMQVKGSVVKRIMVYVEKMISHRFIHKKTYSCLHRPGLKKVSAVSITVSFTLPIVFSLKSWKQKHTATRCSAGALIWMHLYSEFVTDRYVFTMLMWSPSEIACGAKWKKHNAKVNLQDIFIKCLISYPNT